MSTPTLASELAEYVTAARDGTDAHVPGTGDVAYCMRCRRPWPCPDYLGNREALNHPYRPSEPTQTLAPP